MKSTEWLTDMLVSSISTISTVLSKAMAITIAMTISITMAIAIAMPMAIAIAMATDASIAISIGKLVSIVEPVPVGVGEVSVGVDVRESVSLGNSHNAQTPELIYKGDKDPREEVNLCILLECNCPGH